MRTTAKPSTAGSNQRRARGRGRVVIAALVAALSFLALAPLSQAKMLVSGFGTQAGGEVNSVNGGTAFGGQFLSISSGTNPTGLAVNTSGVGAPAGTTYVADFTGGRVQRFGPSGAFERLWGQDVVAPTVDEAQRIRIDAAGGAYTLTVAGFTTDAIPFDANFAKVEDFLAALPSVGGNANVSVFKYRALISGDFVAVFDGALAGTDLPQMAVDGSSLTGTAEVSTLANGDPTTADTGTGFEICTVALECKAGRRPASLGGTENTTANGGQLGLPQGVAVDQATGHIFVTDVRFLADIDMPGGAVSEFDADGNFLRKWGWDVVFTGRPGDVPGTSEVQEVTLGANTTGGTFRLSAGILNEFEQDSAPIAWDASAAEVQEALEAVPVIGAGNVSVSSANPGGGVVGGPYTVTYQNALADANVLQMTPGATGLTVSSGSKSVTVSTTTAGAPGGFEICTVAADCKTMAAGGGDGGRFGEAIGYPAVDASGDVWVPDGTNRRIQRFDSEGNFLAAYGWDVDALGGGGELEECTSTAPGACKAATEGSVPGQFVGASPTQIAFDSSGNLYALDSNLLGASNDRVQKFDPTLLASVEDFGAAALDAFTTRGPENIAATEDGTGLALSLQNDVSGGGERQIVELDPSDESVTDTSLAGAGLDNIRGLGAGDGGELYATSGSVPAAPSPPRQVLVFGDTPPGDPTLALKAVTTKTDTTATLRATVDPQDGLLECDFQYSVDQSGWTDVPEADCNALVPTGTQALSQGVTGLDPNTHYFFRLRVSRPLIPSSELTSSILSFDTDAPPPLVSDVGAIQVTDTSARLAATIDPRNSSTGYVFEYGPTPALGLSTAPLNIGGGTDQITVSRVVAGLEPNTDYYFRLAATNLSGTTTSPSETFHTRADAPPPSHPGSCPNEARRQEQGSTGLPACRAYEMVSPPDKNQGSAIGSTLRFAQVAFAGDGEGVAFCSNALFGDPPAQQAFNCAHYIARRGPGGWTSRDSFPHYCPFGIDGAGGSLKVHLPGESYDRAAIEVPEFDSPCDPIDPSAPQPSVNLYRQDFTSNPADFDLLAPSNTGFAGEGIEAANFGGGADDLSHVVYTSFYNQTPGSPVPEEEFAKLYDWEEEGEGTCATPGGCLSLVSVDPAGEPFTTDSKLPGFSYGVASTPMPSAVSADGERIYFQNPAFTNLFPADNCNTPTCELYLREDGATTLHVSASECTVSCGSDATPDQFRWASPSGDIAVFRSCAKLTDASSPASFCAPAEYSTVHSGKLYRWDRGGAPGNRLVDLSVDQEPADGIQPHALDMVGASDAGDVVYFVADGQLVAGEPTGTISGTGLKLYRWRWNGGSPSLDYLAPYLVAWADGTANTSSLESDPNTSRHRERVTPDGRYVAIRTRLALDPAGDRDSDADMYRWSEADGWLCVSCQLPGAASTGHVNGVEPVLIYNSLISEYESQSAEHAISDDGQRIVFSTPDALVPEDVNGEVSCDVVDSKGEGLLYACADVYEWHDGTVSLLTSGTGAKPFMLIGSTRTGRDIFVATAQRMVGWDVDNGIDIYDIRTGGGFPEPQAQPPECEGEGCREGGSDAPDSAGAGTAVFQGAGNPQKEVQSRRCPQGTLRRGNRCLGVTAIARKRCRRLSGAAKRRCIRNQSRRLGKAQRRRARRSVASAHRTEVNRRAAR